MKMIRHLLVEPFLNPHRRDAIPSNGLDDSYGAQLPIAHRYADGKSGRFDDTKAGDRKIRNRCIVAMVPARMVAFRPKKYAHLFFPHSDFALCVSLCTYVIGRFDEGGSHPSDVSQINNNSHYE